MKRSNKIKDIFNNISCKYDFLNNLLSFGLHNLWKRKLINLLKPLDGEYWADLCCGTGDLAFLLNKRVMPNGKVMGVDSAQEILQIAIQRSKDKDHIIDWKMDDIFDLDESKFQFDGICMSYGLRNLKDVKKGILKIYLLLKNGGKAGILDFSNSKAFPVVNFFQKIYLRLIVVPISMIYGYRKEYSYIERSIMDFPEGKDLIFIAQKIGFKKVVYKYICGGQMGILILEK